MEKNMETKKEEKPKEIINFDFPPIEIWEFLFGCFLLIISFIVYAYSEITGLIILFHTLGYSIVIYIKERQKGRRNSECNRK